MEFSHELALALVQSTDQFPVDFDAAWKWIGYSTKQKAKNKLTNNFDVGIDYTLTKNARRVKGNNSGGSIIYEDIRLTADCFERLKAITPKPKQLIENQVRDKLASQLKGKTEVMTLAGNIDILTSTEVIEVKEVRLWKAAVGQVSIYRNYYPRHTRRIHLFGSAHSRFKEMVERNCHKLHIRITWDN